MADSEHNDDFEAYLKRRIPIDRRLTLINRLEPPPELDRIIIGQARMAIQGSAPVTVFRGPRWALPMGLAATILVSLSLLLDVGMRGAIRKDAANQLPVMASRTAPEEVATQIVEDQLPPGVVSESAAAAEPAAAAAPALAPAQAPAPASVPAAPTPRRAAVASATGSQQVPLARPVTRMKASPVRAAPVAENAAADSAPRDDGRIRLAGRSLAAGRMRTAEGTSGSAVPTPIATFSMDPMETVTITGTRIRTQSGVVSGAPATIFPEQPTRATVGSAAERHKHPDPRAWLDYIEKMRAQGLTAEAEQEFKHFRDVYPGYSVPPEAAPADGRPQ